MNKEFLKKCDEIFENKNNQKICKEKLQEYENLTGLKVSPELLYILENYEGVMINEGYGFVSQQLSPFANAEGYETIIEFIGLNTKYDLIGIYEMLKEQLPCNIYPIAEMDGGNYICISNNEEIYIWLHEHLEQEGLFLANTSIEKFILSIEKMPKVNTDIDISQIESEYSDDFWD